MPDTEEKNNVIQNTILFVGFMFAAYCVLYIAGIEYVATLFVIVFMVVLIAYFFWRIRSIKLQAEMKYFNGKTEHDEKSCSSESVILQTKARQGSNDFSYTRRPLLPRIKDLRMAELAAAGKYFT